MQDQNNATLAGVLFLPRLFSFVFATSSLLFIWLRHSELIGEVENLFGATDQEFIIGALVLVAAVQLARMKYLSHLEETTTLRSDEPAQRYFYPWLIPLVVGQVPAELGLIAFESTQTAITLCGISAVNALLCWPNAERVRRLRQSAGIGEDGQKLPV